jgi:hypothetical protein
MAAAFSALTACGIFWLEVRVTQRIVEVLHRAQRVVSHIRCAHKGGHTTMPEHLPKAHQAHLQWTPERLIHWGQDIGMATGSLVKRIFELLELDCASMPSSILAGTVSIVIEPIFLKEIAGCMVLIDNINEADAEWRVLLDQYADHYFDAYVNNARKQISLLPENLFLVGEQRPD